MNQKLSKDQINFLEHYLIKNKVKYWDIRVELLDHIATEVEARMQNGQSFDKALEEVHVAFGNKVRFKKLSKDQTEWLFTESIYADSSGYKKLVMEKQKELNRGFRKSFFTNLISMFKNPIFWVVYGMVGYFLFRWAEFGDTDFIGKVIIISLLVIPVVHMLIPTFLGLKRKKQSLYLNLLTPSSLFIMGIMNVTLRAITKPVSPWVCFILYLVFIPILATQTLMFVQHSKKYKQFYLKWNKAS